MPKKLMMNNGIDEDTIILCEHYSPNGQKFYLWENKPIHLDENELYMNVDFTKCKGGVWENVLSIGLNISVWGGYDIHMYFEGRTFQVNYVDNTGSYTRLNVSLQSSINEIVVNKDGIFINNTPQNFNQDDGCYKAVMNKLLNDSVSIGSQEGATRSNATYNLVCLRKYQERGGDSVR